MVRAFAAWHGNHPRQLPNLQRTRSQWQPGRLDGTSALWPNHPRELPGPIRTAAPTIADNYHWPMIQETAPDPSSSAAQTDDAGSILGVPTRVDGPSASQRVQLSFASVPSIFRLLSLPSLETTRSDGKFSACC